MALKLFSKRFDRGGHLAISGKLSKRLLSLLRMDEFFSGKTVSTGRETFGTSMVDRIIEYGKQLNLPHRDLMRTVSELTVLSIVSSVRKLVKADKSLTKLYLTGGGRHNNFIVDRLKYTLPGLDIRSADELGVNADYIEAVAFAVMGESCLRSETLDGNVKNIRPVNGHIVQPPVRS